MVHMIAVCLFHSALGDKLAFLPSIYLSLHPPSSFLPFVLSHKKKVINVGTLNKEVLIRSRL